MTSTTSDAPSSSASSLTDALSAAAKAAQGQSAGTFVTSLLSGLAWGLIQIALFILLKDRIPKLYQPKSFLVSARQRVKPIAPGIYRWIKPLFNRNDEEFLRKAGLDGYFLCRYLIVLLWILGPAALLFIPVLIPLNLTGGGGLQITANGTTTGTVKGLDRLTIANISSNHLSRLWAHYVLAVLLVIWTCYVIYAELRRFVKVRQAYLTTPQHRIRASASTVLIQSLPKKYLDQEILTNLFDVYPGGIRNIWLNRDYKELTKLIKQRKKIAKKLENAESILIRKCWASHLKKLGSSKPTLDTTDKALDGEGISANDPGQVHHTVDEAVIAANRISYLDSHAAGSDNIVGRGIGTVTKSIRDVGQGLGNLGKGVVGETQNGLRRVLSRKVRRSTDAAEEMVNYHPDETLNPAKTEIEQEGSNRKSPYEEQPFNASFDDDGNTEPAWRKYIDEKDRPTMRVADQWTWYPKFANPKAKKVDTIYYCRRQLARLNKIIEESQLPEVAELYPPMNSVFIQFNNQAAAHMACQTLTHQTPSYMTPRLVEISPNDVLWKNLSLPWWKRYLQRAIVFLVSLALVIAFIPLIAITSMLSQLDSLRKSTEAFRFASNWNTTTISIIQSIVPVILVNLWIFLLGVLLRIIIKKSGSPTKMQAEITLQKYFFAFAFIQYFLVITLASAAAQLASYLISALQGSFNISVIPSVLANQIPTVSSYFISNILIQSIGQSAAGLFQLIPLILLIFRLLFNSSARAKFKTRTNLQNMTWGTTYPIYTVMACIALIFCVTAPLILPLTCLGFFLWWISTRYQMLYIFRYTIDSGGSFFPIAIHQLFAGIYVMELFLFGYLLPLIFTNNDTATTANTVKKGPLFPLLGLLTVTAAGTVIFQFMLSRNFGPLLTYLPITLEEEAVARDEEFERLLATKHYPEAETRMLRDAAQGGKKHDNDDEEEGATEGQHPEPAIESQATLKSKSGDVEDPSDRDDPFPEELLDPKRTSRGPRALSPGEVGPDGKRRSWMDRGRRSPMFSRNSSSNQTPIIEKANAPKLTEESGQAANSEDEERAAHNSPVSEQEKAALTRSSTVASRARQSIEQNPVASRGMNPNELLHRVADVAAMPVQFFNPGVEQIEAQNNRLVSEAKRLYSNIPDDLEDLSLEERDALVSQAFKHQALREKRPCIWIPRDRLGVGDDEVRNMAQFSKWIWVSNERQELNAKGKPIYTGPPPDFDQVDLIQL